jgi:porin
VTPWLQLEPDVQYVIEPGGTGEIPNALVLGAQIAINL